MAAAMTGILSAAKRYTIILKRPFFNWQAGTAQAPYLVLDETDTLDFAGQVDERFARAREVVLLITTADEGVARIGVTTRTWEILAASPAASRALHDFEMGIRESARSRLFTVHFAKVLGSWVLAWFLVVTLVPSVLDPAFRGILFGGAPGDLPGWFDTVLSLGFYAWLAGCLVGIPAIALVRLRSGGLRTWPESLSIITLFEAVHRIRGSATFWTRFVEVILAVVAGVAIAKLSDWL